MYCDPVSCICLTADNTHMVVASRLRSALEYQISRLSVFFTDHIGIEPLLRSSVSYAALHSLVQISIDHRPGNKSAAVQSVGSCTSCTWTSCRIYLSAFPQFASLPMAVDLPPQKYPTSPTREYAAVITFTRSSETSSPTLWRTKPFASVTTAQRSLQSVSTYF